MRLSVKLRSFVIRRNSMHELGIVVHISKTLEELAQENNITDIRRVTLQIGKVSGIVPEYLVDCWKYYRKKVPLIENSSLEYVMNVKKHMIRFNMEENVHIVRANIQFYFKVMSASLRRLKPNKRRKALFLCKNLKIIRKSIFFFVYEYVGNAY